MYLYGASGHAKVIIEILEAQGIKVEGLFDDNEFLEALLDYPVYKWDEKEDRNKKIIISIGNNSIRKKIVDSISGEYEIAIHPKSILSQRSIIGLGTVIMGGVTINVNTYVGKHCIVNTNASVDHDCVLDDFVHISPNVALCGNVHVGEGTHVGAGSVVIPGKRIGKWCVIGAGSVVINDIPDYSIAVGNPCKIIKSLH
jgi:sugar O-acyltransferase (sialic acid O-acetyltransferase NeuD family)